MGPDDEWLGDEEGDELPVIGPVELAERHPVTSQAHRKCRPAQSPRGGVPIADVADVRRAVLAEATGKAMAEPEQWRTDMELGNRNRAAASLGTGGRRRGASSGFGLA